MKNIPWLLLDKHFKGLLTDRDQEEYNSWLESAIENQLFVDEIESDLEKGLPFPGDFTSDKQRTWMKLRNRIGIPCQTGFSSRMIYRAVAAVTIPLLFVSFAGGWYWHKTTQYNTDNSEYTVVISPKGQRTQIILPDSSKVWLNSNTTIKYPSTFNQKDRSIYIDGEAYFDVTHNESKPFIVNTSLFNIKVYGTTFNVSAYKEDKIIETTLVKGKISISGIRIKGEKAKEIILLPNESFKYIKNEQTVEYGQIKEAPALPSSSSEVKKTSPAVSTVAALPQVFISKHVDVEPIIGWKEGKIFFDNETFESLATKFERKYDVRIHFEDQRVTKLKYTGVFEKENINQALDALKLTTPFEYKMNLKEIYISYRK